MVYLFILSGLLLASFLNATMYRIEKGMKWPEIAIKPSHCESCNKGLRWYELVPVLSYVITLGKCSGCKKKISWYYPISELLLGLSFGVLYLSPTSWYSYIFLLFLFILSYQDFENKEVSSSIVHAMMGFGVLVGVYRFFSIGDIYVLSGLFLSLIIVGLVTILNKFKKSFGLGDLLILIALSFEFSGLELFLFSMLSVFWGAFISVPLVISDKKWLKKYVPFIPFMYLGYVVTIGYGDEILLWFANLTSLW